jgi:hypothetical protein
MLTALAIATHCRKLLPIDGIARGEQLGVGGKAVLTSLPFEIATGCGRA